MEIPTGHCGDFAMYKSLLIALTVAGLGFGVVAAAQSPLPENQTAPSGQSTQKAVPVTRNVLKPGDRNCLRSTGSLIPAKEGTCLPVAGRSYSGDELRRTGFNDTGRALEALDPSISVGH
jgi:hypothetical protein